MARYTGPRLKICRQLGVILPGLTSASTLERPFPPGEHGTRRRGKVSDYKLRLIEKQKLRYHYGLLERQFKRYVSNAARRKGPTGDNLIGFLESRLDNVVWRIGLAATIPAARQLVTHGHIVVDGKRVDRPSFQVRVGQTIGVKEKSKAKPFIQEALALSATRLRPIFLEFDPAKAEGKMTSPPSRDEVPFEVNTQAVIEYYSQQL
jgi:small subunit ribosomal protein S4